MSTVELATSSFQSVNRAFSKQSLTFDADDQANPILINWRSRIYRHLEKYLKPGTRLLELNAGTGIDASYLVNKGHFVHATDVSDGMIAQIQQKIKSVPSLENRLTCQQLSFTELTQLEGTYDHIFSNFGGLNCADDLHEVCGSFPALLQPDGMLTLVIMPPQAPWEWLWLLRGKPRMAFRRNHKDGVMAHLEGEYFKTYYYSYRQVKAALGSSFRIVKCEGLGIVSPPPGSTSFYRKFEWFVRLLERFDKMLAHWPVLRRMGDHIIVTAQYLPNPR